MKAMRRVLAFTLLAVIVCVSLCGCGPQKEDVYGTWSGSWTFEGKSFVSTFKLNTDGTFVKVVSTDGVLKEPKTGTWELSGSKVVLSCDDALYGETLSYKYKDGSLYNSGHKHDKLQ